MLNKREQEMLKSLDKINKSINSLMRKVEKENRMSYESYDLLNSIIDNARYVEAVKCGLFDKKEEN